MCNKDTITKNKLPWRYYIFNIKFKNKNIPIHLLQTDF